MIPDDVTHRLAGIAGEPLAGSVRAVHGGCINRCYRYRTADGGRYFVKLNTAARLDMFEAEFDGLEALGLAGAIRVPAPIACGESGDCAWLLLEGLELGGCSEQAAARLGAALASQHRKRGAAHGWRRDNSIGRTPQRNTNRASWIEFWRSERLGYQIELAVRNGYPRLEKPGEELGRRLAEFFDGYEPVPSLLHGDLWGGNWDALAGGEPVVFDPAVYFGDRETDIAMTRLFGGFDENFYTAYEQAWPLDAGFSRRQDLYNLYHILNHLNLFGGAYLRQAAAMLDKLLGRSD